MLLYRSSIMCRLWLSTSIQRKPFFYGYIFSFQLAQLAEALDELQVKWCAILQKELSQLCASLESLSAKSARLGPLGIEDLPLPRHPAADTSVTSSANDCPFSELESTYAHESAGLRQQIVEAYSANIAELKQVAATLAARLGLTFQTASQQQ